MLVALKELANDESTIRREYLQIELIGEILQSFLNQYDLRQCLKKVRDYAHGAFFDYKYRDSTYTGTFFDCLTTDDGGTIRHQLTVRLSHDAFQYPNVPEDAVVGVVARSGIGYQVLNAAYIQNLDALRMIQEITESETFSFFYQRDFRRIDIEFYENGTGTPVNLTIRFDHGRPKAIMKQEYLIDLRNK